MKNILYILGFALIALSCEGLIIKDLDLKDTGFEKQIVIQSIIEGGSDSIKALISENISILENFEDIVFIEDAEVRVLKDGAEIANLVQAPDGFYYHYFDEPLTETGEYEMVVSNTNYAEARATSTIPNNPVVTDLEFKYNVGTDPLEMNEISEISFIIQDEPGENYYSVELVNEPLGYDTFIYEMDTSIYEITMAAYPSTQLDPAVMSSGFSDKLYISDESFQGKSYRISLRYFIYLNGLSIEPDDLEENLKIRIVSHSVDSYNYTTSIDRYQESGDFGFFSEPVSVYTNIENGLGIFAGANSKIYKFVE